MKKKIVFWIVSIGIIGLWVFGGIPVALNGDDTYSGQVVFNTEGEYIQFKQTLVEAKATWDVDNMNVMSSAPPIIVRFTVQVPRLSAFDYGEKASVQLANAILLSVVGIFFLGVWWLVMGGDKDVRWLFK